MNAGKIDELFYLFLNHCRFEGIGDCSLVFTITNKHCVAVPIDDVAQKLEFRVLVDIDFRLCNISLDAVIYKDGIIQEPLKQWNGPIAKMTLPVFCDWVDAVGWWNPPVLLNSKTRF